MSHAVRHCVCSHNLAGCLPVLDRGMIGAFAAAKAFFSFRISLSLDRAGSVFAGFVHRVQRNSDLV